MFFYYTVHELFDSLMGL